MNILLNLIKDILFNKPTPDEINSIQSLSSAHDPSIADGIPFVENSSQPASIDQSLQVAAIHHKAGQLNDAEAIYRTILKAQPQNTDANYNLGMLLLQAGQSQAAIPFLQTALEVNPANGQYRLSMAECYMQLRAWNEAGALLHDAEATGLRHPAVAGMMGQIAAGIDQSRHIQAAKNRFPGHDYMCWLKWLHQKVKPATYVEIGVESGQSLQFAQHPTKAVGIDPSIRIIHSQESWVKLYKLTSDEFFIQHDLRQVLGAEFVDMAFIDGLHTFDQALKDFINIERYAHPGTVVAFHDIFPVTAITADRDCKTIFWLGDTWKVVLILKEMRHDLKIFTLPAYPSGLTIVTGLNADSNLLSRELEQIIERWMEIKLDPYLTEMDAHLNVVGNDIGTVSRLLEF